MIPLDFTGERFIPGHGGCQLAYEHLHRYLYAARCARGRRVIDVACGSGYGAALLAGVAERVWAMDLDGPTIAAAQSTCPQENLHFIHADATHLPFKNGGSGLAVAMEVIEHLPDPEGLVSELARVTLPDGAALISTPDKSTYSDARQYSNPYHVHEFYRAEFLALLGRHFPRVLLMSQQVRAGSLIARESESGGDSEIITLPPPQEKRQPVGPMYLLAFCSGCDSTVAAPSQSAYLDPTDAMFAEGKSEILRLNAEIQNLGRWATDLEKEIAERDTALRELQERMSRELEERDGIIRSLQQELDREIARRDQALERLQREFESRTSWAMSLTEDVKLRDRQLDHANSELEKVGDHLARIRRAFLYRVLCRLGLLRK